MYPATSRADSTDVAGLPGLVFVQAVVTVGVHMLDGRLGMSAVRTIERPWDSPTPVKDASNPEETYSMHNLLLNVHIVKYPQNYRLFAGQSAFTAAFPLADPLSLPHESVLASRLRFLRLRSCVDHTGSSQRGWHPHSRVLHHTRP
jgi:hypothetical protein